MAFCEVTSSPGWIRASDDGVLDRRGPHSVRNCDDESGPSWGPCVGEIESLLDLDRVRLMSRGSSSSSSSRGCVRSDAISSRLDRVRAKTRSAVKSRFWTHICGR